MLCIVTEDIDAENDEDDEGTLLRIIVIGLSKSTGSCDM